ncbi:MAG: DNA gyrase C-terminal beta-propeller domain-containing protein, partial [Stenotrophobium sp.]
YEEDPKAELMRVFGLTEIQTEAILDLKLRHLQKLEEMRIKGEQAELAAERARLEELLGDDDKLKKLIGEEIREDAKKYGDDRRCPINARPPAQALEATEILPAEMITVVLSRAGWIRAGKGHELDAQTLSYKAGDEFMCAVQGRTNHLLVLLDSRGRCYTLNPRELPSARSQGEPVTTKLDLQDGARIIAMMLAEPTDRFVLASDQGYGFYTQLNELQARNRAGKAVVTIAEGGTALSPAALRDPATDRYALATAEGRLLVFPLAELPEMSKGKGNKLIGLKGEDRILAACVIAQGASLTLVCGKRTLTLKPSDIDNYAGARASRGGHLPRGFQRVDSMVAEPSKG